MTCGCDARRTEDRTESVRAEESICVLSIATVGFATNSASVVIGAPTAMPVPDQVLARTHPTLDDLEVALCAGFAAAYMLVRRESLSALPGVAIAVALVPPLCSAGILLYFGARDLVWNAILLFLTNASAMDFPVRTWRRRLVFETVL